MDTSPTVKSPRCLQQGGDARYERQRRYQQRRYKTDKEFKEKMKQRVVQQRSQKMNEDEDYKQALYKKHAAYLRDRYKNDPEYAEKRREQSRLAYQKRKEKQKQQNT